MSDTTAVESEAASVEGDLPDWLAGLGGEEPASEALPDWSAGLERETAAPPAPSAGPEAAPTLPDWLSGLTEPDIDAAPSSLADWLSEPAEVALAEHRSIGLPDQMPTAPELAAEPAPPDWLQDLIAPESPPPAPKPARPLDLPLTEPDEAVDLPDWLSGLVSEPAAEEEETAAAPPDWLSGLVSEPAAEEEEKAAAAPPDWLSGLVSEPAAEEEEEVAAAPPDWLSGLVSEPAAEEEETVAAPPDWLSGMLAAEEEEETGSAWLRGIAPEKPAAPAVEEEPLELDWAHGITDETETPPSDRRGGLTFAEPAAEEEEVLELDWTRGFPEEESVSEEAHLAPPLAFAGFVEEAAPQAGRDSADALLPARPLPDWLRAIADPAAPPPAGPAEMPAWLLHTADRSAPPPATGVAPLPDWLLANAEVVPVTPLSPEPAAVSLAPSQPSRIPPAPTPASPAAELPDWIVGIVPETEPAVTPTTSAPELPDWITGMASEAEAAEAFTPSPAGDSAPVELPDWLAEIAGEPAVAEVARAPEPVKSMPDWLADSAPAVEKLKTPVVPEGGEPEKTELPDWLAGIVAEAEADEEIPDWLSAPAESDGASHVADIFEPATAAPESALPGRLGRETPAAALFTETPEVAETPDWLKAVEPAPTGHPAARPARAGAPPVKGAVPDWLASIAEEEGAMTPATPAFVPGEGETEADELSALQPDAAVALPSGETPSWLEELTAPAEEGPLDVMEMSGGDDLARANVPVWLQELRPTGTGPLPGLPPEIAGILDAGAPAAGGTAGLAQAEIPEWVQQLRPTVTGAGEVVSEKYMGPAETTGPLVGLAGVIVPLAGVDIAPDFVPTPLPQPPEVIVQQAHLWQQLLEQPRGKARPVAQQRGRPGLRAALLRIALALLLFAAAALGLLWEGESLAQAPEPGARPGLGLLKHLIETLQPGDVVIFAVEYGPAEAVEMQPIAQTLLEQLAAQQVNVIAVSTLPEGPGLIQGLLAGQAITNHLLPTESVYRVGGDSGIADLLSRGEVWEADMVVVAAARPAPLRGWIEQNAAARRPLPLAVGANAATGALVTAYYDTRGLNGWLVGFADLVAYRQMLYQSDFAQMGALALPQVLNALLLTHWVAAGFLLFGLLYAVTAGKKGAA